MTMPVAISDKAVYELMRETRKVRITMMYITKPNINHEYIFECLPVFSEELFYIVSPVERDQQFVYRPVLAEEVLNGHEVGEQKQEGNHDFGTDREGAPGHAERRVQ